MKPFAESAHLVRDRVFAVCGLGAVAASLEAQQRFDEVEILACLGVSMVLWTVCLFIWGMGEVDKNA